MISDKDPLEIVIIKGWGCGIGSLVIALLIGERLPDTKYIVPTPILGFLISMHSENLVPQERSSFMHFPRLSAFYFLII